MEKKDYLIEKPMVYIDVMGPFFREIGKRGDVGEWKLRDEYKSYIVEEAIYRYFISSPHFKRLPKIMQQWIHDCDCVWRIPRKNLEETRWMRKIK